MPTVLTIYGCRVAIYFNDHRPAHVHVLGADAEAVFNLHCPDGPPELRENDGFSRARLRQLKDALATNIGQLCEAWREIHGDH